MKMYEGAELPDGVELYDMEDYDKTRELMQDSARDAMVKLFPREHNGVRMELDNVDYTDSNEYSFKDQKLALHNDKYLSRRLRGDLRLYDTKTGELLDEKKGMTLMHVPWITERGTFIKDGNEWGTISQQRLIPGAYSRYQTNGDLETQFNVRTGTGAGFRVNFNPESTIYKMSIGGAEINMYSLLHDLGVDDDTLRDKWGDSVFEKNAASYDPRTLDKAYDKVVPAWDRDKNPDRSRQEKVDLIRRALDRSQISEAVARKTLPTMFSSDKRAAWKTGVRFFEKAASMSKSDLQDIASYINATAETKIDVTGLSKEELKEVIMHAISDVSEGSQITDPGKLLVQQMRMKRFVDKLNNKLNMNILM